MSGQRLKSDTRYEVDSPEELEELLKRHGAKGVQVSRWLSGQSVYVRADGVGTRFNAYYREHVLTGRTGKRPPSDNSLYPRPFTPADERKVRAAERRLLKSFSKLPVTLRKGKPLATASADD